MKLTKAIAALAAASLALIAGCTTPTEGTPSSSAGDTSTAASGGSSSGALNITMLPKNLGNPYFDQSTAGAEEAAGEIGATITQVGPTTEGVADSQVEFIEAATQQGVTAIELSANDKDALCDSVKAAQAKGIKVVTFDSDTSCRDLFINQVSVDGVAQSLFEMIEDQTGGSGEIAILSAGANATNQNAWIDALKKLLETKPDIKLDDVVYGDDADQKSFDETKGLLSKYPDLKLIVAPTTVGITAAARYVSSSDKKGKVLVTGLGTPGSMKPYLADGTTKEFALWNPKDLGYLTTYAVKALVDGTITGAEGDKFTAGRLGDYTVGANGEVPLGPAFKFNASNIDQFPWG
ncbi:MAG: rhamnose ABC transporter substrate-binding protein [Propionibacteriaceae bacterium]|jgi:rhamnose transport system substrate-binding protein|nr:rhamnose ABC transporter substrate-binding protein [Propionibacteriaceae bacterium]